jgi:putative chitinase
MIDQAALSAVAPHAPEGWVEPLNIAMARFSITEPREQAAFLAQIAEESGELTHLEENLHYSPQRLMQVWPRLFPTLEHAEFYSANPEHLASLVYADRYGNGSEESEDGWKFRGRGLIQITFRDNYRDFGYAIGDVKVLAYPDLLATNKDYAALSAAWFWRAHKLDRLADTGLPQDFNSISRIINGGDNGRVARLQYWSRALKALGETAEA